MNFTKNRKWDESSSPRLSVVMIGHRRADLLSRAISSFAASCPSSDWELVLIVNGQSKSVGTFAASLLHSENFPLAVVNIAECRPGAARNHGVRVARSPLLFFLDDDIECYQDIASAALELFRDPEILAAGGANLTPPKSGALERATGSVMASWVGAASMRKRYRLSDEGPASEHGLILCNLAVRRSVFLEERGFAKHMISNEENVLLQRLSGKNGKLWSSPRLAVFHCRRDTWKGLCGQAAKYGAGRAQNLLLLPETFSVLYFLPLLLWAYLLSLLFLLPGGASWALVPLLAYIAATVPRALFLAAWKRDLAEILALAVFPCVHLAYGWGFFKAMLLWSLRRKELLEHSA